MDCKKVGKLIYDLRKENNMTQKELADKIMISDKTVSKWERGLGCPDVSLLSSLSKILKIDIEKILEGELSPNEKDGGNMKKIKFYICPTCKNIITASGEADISCCGRKLEPLIPKFSDEKHNLKVETIEDELYITFSHEMKKEHYICFVAYVTYDRIMMVRLYPEQSGEVRFPNLHGGKFYFGCNKHGLFLNK